MQTAPQRTSARKAANKKEPAVVARQPAVKAQPKAKAPPKPKAKSKAPPPEISDSDNEDQAVLTDLTLTGPVLGAAFPSEDAVVTGLQHKSGFLTPPAGGRPTQAWSGPSFSKAEQHEQEVLLSTYVKEGKFKAAEDKVVALATAAHLSGRLDDGRIIE